MRQNVGKRQKIPRQPEKIRVSWGSAERADGEKSRETGPLSIRKKQGPHPYGSTDVVLFQGENGQWNKKICCIIIKVKSV